MNKITISIISSLIGAGIGGAVTYFYMNKKYADIREENTKLSSENKELREHFTDKVLDAIGFDGLGFDPNKKNIDKDAPQHFEKKMKDSESGFQTSSLNKYDSKKDKYHTDYTRFFNTDSNATVSLKDENSNIFIHPNKRVSLRVYWPDLDPENENEHYTPGVWDDEPLDEREPELVEATNPAIAHKYVELENYYSYDAWWLPKEDVTAILNDEKQPIGILTEVEEHEKMGNEYKDILQYSNSVTIVNHAYGEVYDILRVDDMTYEEAEENANYDGELIPYNRRINSHED